MTAYFGLFILVFFLSVFLNRYNNLFLFISSLLLLFFVGFRHNVGGDWYTYEFMYDNVLFYHETWVSVLYGREPFYHLLDWVGRSNNWGVYFTNSACAAIFLYGLSCFCNRQYNPNFSFFISLPYLVFVVAMGYTRQSAAIGVVFLAVNAFLDKKDLKFIGFIALAVAFHMTSVIMFCLLIIRLSPMKIFRFFLVFCVLSFLFYNYVGYRLIDKLDLYTEGGLDSKGFYARFIFSFFAAVFFLVYHKSFKRKKPDSYALLVILVAVNFLLFGLGFLYSTIADRLFLYFIFFQILVFANLPMMMSARGRLVAYACIGLAYCVQLLVWLKYSFYAQNYWIPYDNLLFNLF